MTPEEVLLEKVAAMVHDNWIRWMKYFESRALSFGGGPFVKDGMVLHDSEINGGEELGRVMVIPPECYERWDRQMETPYEELSEKEKESDRKYARKFIELIEAGKHDQN